MATQTTGGGSTTSFTNTPQAGDDRFEGYNEDFAGIAIFNVMQNDLGGKAKILWALDDGENDSGLMNGYEAADLLAQDLARMESCSTDTSENGARIWITSDGQVGYDAGTLSTAFRNELNSLADGETAYDSFIYSIRLANGTLSWARAYVQYSGVNDAPTVSAFENGAVTEDADDPTLSDSGIITFDDVDLSDTHSVSSVTPDLGNSLAGVLTASVTDPATGAGDGTVSWSYSVDNAAVQYLDGDESIQESFTVRIADNHGGFVDQVITVTINGENDAATITATSPAAYTESDTSDVVSANVADYVTITDPDSQDAADPDDYVDGSGSVLASGPTPPAGTLDDLFDFDAATGAFSFDRADFNWLDDDQSVTYTISFDAQSGDDGLVARQIIVTINGENDAAVVSVADVTDSEADTSSPQSFLIADKVSQTDADSQDTAEGFVDYVAGSGSVTNATGTNGATPPAGAVSVNATTGEVTYDRAAFNFLDADQSVTYTITFNTKSGDDAEQIQTLTVTINGENDAATITATDPDDYSESDTSDVVSANVADYVTITDPDSQDAADPDDYVDGSGTVLASGPTPPAGTLDDLFDFDDVTGAFSFDRGDFNWLDDDQSVTYTISFQAESGDDGPVNRSITVTINGENDAATITSDGGGATATASVAENTTAVTTVTATDPDAGATITFSIVGGADSSLFTIDPNTGALAFVSAPDFETPGDAGNDNVYDVVVRASDGTLFDDQAIAVTVTDVGEGPNAVGETIITNIALGTGILIPEWALLVNDPPSAVDVTNVGGATGGTVVHNAGIGSNGNVTFTDTAPAGGSFTYSATNGTSAGAAATASIVQDAVGTLDGTANADILVSGTGGAILIGGDGNDVLLGGSGNDTYRFDLSDGFDIIFDNGSGNDRIEITTSLPVDSTSIDALNFERIGTNLVIDVGSTELTVRDHYVSGNEVERIQFTNGGTIYGYALSSGDYRLSNDSVSPLDGAGTEDVIASSSGAETVNGGNGSDLLFGNGGVDTINGGNGNDLIVAGAGDDILNGGADNDVIVGGLGADQMTGGTGADRFAFESIADSANANPDRIIDFSEATAGELIDLSLIDANTGLGGDQAFAFAGNTTTVSANSINWFVSGGNTFVQGDVNGDAVADFTIRLDGVHALTGAGAGSDFIF
jgi:VCBS repeat-containing protein